MTDNIKTWPEKIYLRHHIWTATGLEVTTINDTTGHEYIRGDVVKERERELINASKLLCDITINLRDPRFPTTEEIYEKAGLEELKCAVTLRRDED